jgi:hypothetical protein
MKAVAKPSEIAATSHGIMGTPLRRTSAAEGPEPCAGARTTHGHYITFTISTISTIRPVRWAPYSLVPCNPPHGKGLESRSESGLHFASVFRESRNKARVPRSDVSIGTVMVTACRGLFTGLTCNRVT